MSHQFWEINVLTLGVVLLSSIILKIIFGIDIVNYEDDDILEKRWSTALSLLMVISQPILCIITAVTSIKSVSIPSIALIILQVILVVIECIVILSPQKVVSKIGKMEKTHFDALKIISIPLGIVWTVNLLVITGALKWL